MEGSENFIYQFMKPELEVNPNLIRSQVIYDVACYMEYDLNTSPEINFLPDFYLSLRSHKLNDPKIVEKVNAIARDKTRKGSLKVACERSNYNEREVIKQLLMNKRERKEKKSSMHDMSVSHLELNSLHSPVKEKKKRKTTDSEDMEKTIGNKRNSNLQFEIINTNIRDSPIGDFSERHGSEGNRFVTLTGLRRADSAASITQQATSNMFSDEAFDNIIREYLNINDFPKESKDKIYLLRKFVPIYKKIKNDNHKVLNFAKKISARLDVPLFELLTIFEFEYIRSKKEAAFTTLTKVLNKFCSILAHNKMHNIYDSKLLCENAIINDKLYSVHNKISDYIVNFRNIIAFVKCENSESQGGYNLNIIEAYIPSFSLPKFIVEEGRDRLRKKIKESLMKYNIIHRDDIVGVLNPFEGRNLFKLDDLRMEEEEKVERTEKESKREEDNEGLIKNGYIFSKDEFFNLSMSEASFNFNQAADFGGQAEFMSKTSHSHTRTGMPFEQVMPYEEIKLPIKSRKYLIKQYDNNDFAGEE